MKEDTSSLFIELGIETKLFEQVGDCAHRLFASQVFCVERRRVDSRCPATSRPHCFCRRVFHFAQLTGKKLGEVEISNVVVRRGSTQSPDGVGCEHV